MLPKHSTWEWAAKYIDVQQRYSKTCSKYDKAVRAQVSQGQWDNLRGCEAWVKEEKGRSG